MPFPRYPKYKDSGVAWLEEVPAHWDVVALKRIAHMQSGDGISSDEISEAGDYPVYGGNGLRGFTSGYTHEGLYPLIGRQGALCGNINYSEGRFWASEHAIVVSPLPGVDTKWLGETLRGMNLNQYSVSAAQPGLAVEVIKALRLAVPPPAEQLAIAAFLDRETAKIDALIAEQEKLIALLKEKRQALISHAITKGLDPDVPIKDSGIEWFGQVPAHWAVKPLKYVVTFQSDGTPDKSNPTYWDGMIPWASAKDIKVEVLLDTEDHITDDAVVNGAASVVPAGAVVVVVRGMILARTFPATLLAHSMAINQDLKALCVAPSTEPRFLAWYLRGTAAESLTRLDEAGHGTKALRMDSWSSLMVTSPSLEEQQAIAAYIEERARRIDDLVLETDDAVTLLKERRAALISAAVTGKIDVRGYAETVATAPSSFPRKRESSVLVETKALDPGSPLRGVRDDDEGWRKPDSTRRLLQARS